ncbi:hypothetical protein SLA2020_048650 [Shorea laevis]
MIERRMKALAKARRNKKKKGRTQIIHGSSATETNSSKLEETETEMGTKSSWWREAEELWIMGKQLGLVDNNNAEEVI